MRLRNLYRLDEQAGPEKLYSLEAPGKSFVVRARSREEAIVLLSGVVGKDWIRRHRDQLQQHLGPVVQIDHRTDDIEELDPSDVKHMPPPVPGAV